MVGAECLSKELREGHPITRWVQRARKECEMRERPEGQAESEITALLGFELSLQIAVGISEGLQHPFQDLNFPFREQWESVKGCSIHFRI